MKKIVLLVVLLSILLIGSVMAASAGHNTIRVTGGGHWEYNVTGRAWGRVNFTFDPATYEANGIFNYKSYTYNQPKDWFHWNGKVVCAALGEYDGMPAVSYVIEVIDGWTPGYYAKAMFADGEETDWGGLIVWGLDGPVPDMPNCEFEAPFYVWPVVGGNFTIHP